MTRKKQPPEVSFVRSSAAEYLTFVAATGSQEQAVEMRYEDENIWLSQKMMATLYDVTVPAINQQLKRIFADRELTPDAAIKQLLTTAADGKTNVREVAHCPGPPLRERLRSRRGRDQAPRRGRRKGPVTQGPEAVIAAPRANVGAVVAPFAEPSGIQRGSSGGAQTTPRCSPRCFARHMERSVSASTSAASSIRRSTSARRSSRAALASAASSGGAWSMRPTLRLPSRRQSSAFRDSSRLLSASGAHATEEPSTVTGQRESASLSRRARPKFSESHCERPRRTVRTSEPVRFRSPRAFAERAACGANVKKASQKRGFWL